MSFFFLLNFGHVLLDCVVKIFKEMRDEIDEYQTSKRRRDYVEPILKPIGERKSLFFVYTNTLQNTD